MTSSREDALAAALRLCSSRLALHAVHGNLDAIEAADAALALLNPPTPKPVPEPKRTAFIVHAVAQARAFHRSFLRLLHHDLRRATEARRRRDGWLASARTAKAGAK